MQNVTRRKTENFHVLIEDSCYVIINPLNLCSSEETEDYSWIIVTVQSSSFITATQTHHSELRMLFINVLFVCFGNVSVVKLE